MVVDRCCRNASGCSSERGVVKVTDVSAADYPAVVPGLPDGAYHVYDYLFFYRNLQQNVRVRTARYLLTKAKE